ncbi:GNAT family N-acetyltransferase [Paenibacillus sp. 453mf]|uniref:GNAT family N-acetyltransferase n=1 Tax=Paenibacillus sp. 453mf TaxID=1761874 RepID=UPI0008EE6F1F|nr:GNAT family N-acetyltransferase [Paenibacillus sp. 453mf]SFS55263.1 Acetyltransferase (GNAT) domain-containing protein [Paenibacillus sp. 453mf]
MRIKKVPEYDINRELEAMIQDLLTNSFPKIYPTNRIYFKQLPHLRFLAFNQENQLVGHVGLDYRVMSLNGEPIKVLGIIDLCVSQNTRSIGIGTTLLLEVDKFSKVRNIDFILLFADNMTLYLNNGYKTVKNKCRWLKIDNESQIIKGIGYESVNELMIKEVGKREWIEGDLDLLGYLY